MRRRSVIAAVALLLITLALLRAFLSSAATITPRTPVPKSAALAGLQTGPAPWSRNVGSLRTRLAQLGLPALVQEGTVLHIHQHLDLIVDGVHVPVPAGIGIDARDRFISPIHTHDWSGVIHVESPVVRRFTLGELFGVWGVRLTSRCVGGYCTGRGRTLRVYVNGRRYRGDPRRISLTSHEEIALVFGKARSIPRSYAFPPGL